MLPAKHNAGDVLRRHESKIRKLYATEKVDSVKRIMEREPGFPELALSTWIELIGDLGIRKNVSSDEWRTIYLHCLYWLEDHTRKKGDLKLKRTKQPIEIVVRGRTYSWNQAWKNMKNAGAIGQLPRPGERLGPLPPNVEIRTLSSVSLPVISTSIQGAAPAHGSLSRGLSHPGPSQQSSSHSSDNSLSLVLKPSDYHQNRSNEWTRDCAKKIWIYWTGLLPVGTLIAKTIGIQKLAPPSGEGALQHSQPGPMTMFATDSLPDTFGDAEHGFVNERQCKLRDVFLSALLWPSTVDLATSTSHKNYAKFFTVIYLLSNRFVRLPYVYGHMFVEQPSIHLFRELDLVFAAVPVEYLEILIRRRLVSIRAAYETLVLMTGYYKQQSAFQFLLKIGSRYDWIAVPIWGHQLLYYAVSMGLENALHLLLEKGCRPDLGGVVHVPSNRLFETAICEALRQENLKCTHLLLDYCDVNALSQGNLYGRGQLSNFDCFLFEFVGDDHHLESGINAFVRAGADLNQPVVAPRGRRPTRLGIWNDELWEEVPSCEQETRLSVLDYLFYFHRRLFHAISSKSNRTQPRFFSRASVLLSLEGGIQNLQQYLDSLARRIGQQRLSKFLQLLIAEQFLGCDLAGRKIATDLKRVRALASCSVSITDVLHRFPDILDRFIQLIGKHSKEYNMGAIQYLLENGVHVGGSALSWLVRLPETRLFDLALNHVDSSREWHIALAEVASRNDFQAVERLLHAGVDLGVDTIDPDDDEDEKPLPISLIARFMKESAWKPAELPVMLEFLIKKGAVLRLSKKRPQLHHLLHFVLDQHISYVRPELETQAALQYITSAGYNGNFPLPSSVLAHASDLATFEQLFRYGVQLQPGSPLAHWIAIGGGIGLVREMLAAGASLNDFSSNPIRRRTPLQAAAGRLRADIVELLLEQGADVNAAARGFYGATALQAVCMCELKFTESDEEKVKIIKLLLGRGANVNAAPARRDGRTALQATAATGHLAAAKLLLLNNPMADVNAPPCQGNFEDSEYIPSELGTALDIAAEYGRLDMVKLLLSCNALSHRRGENGYDGAIFLAEERAHLAVADLIREHAKNDQELQIRNPYLSEPRRHWSEYGYKLDLDEDSDSSYETDSTESENTDDESDSPTGTATGISYDADERETPGAIPEQDSVVHPDVNQISEAVYNHGVQISTQPFTNDVLPTAATLGNNTWVVEDDLGLGIEGNDVATMHPMYASHQMDFGALMDLDMSLGSGIEQDVDVQYPGRLDHEFDGPERLIYELGEDCE